MVFFGTSVFAAGILEFLARSSCDLLAVVTRPDMPQGRALRLLAPPVKAKARALSLSIPLLQPVKASTEEFADMLRKFDADIFLVVAYGEILRAHVLAIPYWGCINVHASLLPKYRGAAPIQRCLMDGVKETGITIIEMVPAMDAGPMLEKRAVAVPQDMTLVELERELLSTACIAVQSVIRKIENGTVQKEEQDPSQVSFAPKILPEDQHIDWHRSASQIHNQIRALSPHPGAYLYVALLGEKKRLKILHAQIVDRPQSVSGKLLIEDRRLFLSCGQGTLELFELQLEGKKPVSVGAFLHGLKNPLEVLDIPRTKNARSC